MRHFGHLTAAQTEALFERPPEPFDRDSGLELLSVALGATLYMPADRPALAVDLTKQANAGVTSIVICLEDSVADERLTDAEANLVTALTELHASDPGELPLLFVRVRAVAQLTALVARGHHEELAMHIRAARRNGLSDAEIAEVFLQSAIYCGVPDANTAFRIAAQTLAELNADAQPTEPGRD